jgi:thioredoxin 1
MALELTDSNFKEKVADGVAMVDFWAVWCGPCRAVAPVVEELSNDYQGKAIIGKVDVDNNPEVASEYGIRNIPTILFLKNGEVVDKHVGSAPKTVLEQKLKALLA